MRIYVGDAQSAKGESKPREFMEFDEATLSEYRVDNEVIKQSSSASPPQIVFTCAKNGSQVKSSSQ